ncbi:MAG: YabP/YqfC family sporulation protein [Bacillota bacterium]
MKKRKRALQFKVLQALDLPEETMKDVPKVTLLARQDMLIENHTGILEYKGDYVRVNTPLGVLRVDGASLELMELAAERVYIKGEIAAFCYEG